MSQAIITLDESNPKKHTLVVTPETVYDLQPGDEFELQNNTIHTVYFWCVELDDDGIAFLGKCPHKALPLAAGKSTGVECLGGRTGLVYGLAQSTSSEPEAVFGATKEPEFERHEEPSDDGDDSDDSDDSDDGDDGDDAPAAIDRGTGE